MATPVEPLHVQPEFADATYLERFAPGSRLRLPAGASFRPRTRAGCTLYVKYAGIPGLRPAAGPGKEAAPRPGPAPAGSEPPCRP